LLGGSLDDRIKQQIGDIVSQRSSDQEFHRQVIDALGVLAVVRGFGAHPTLRQDIPDRASHGPIALMRPGTRRSDSIVKQQVAFVKTVIRARKSNRAAAILFKKYRLGFQARYAASADFFCLVHPGFLPYLLPA